MSDILDRTAEASPAPSEPLDDAPVLVITELVTEFVSGEGAVRAVNGVSYEVRRGETLAVVGESGSGKSVTALSILGLIPNPPGRIVGGSVVFEGIELRQVDRKELRSIRGGGIGMIFQDPMTSFNPAIRIGDQIVEAIRTHQDLGRKAARERAIELLEAVGVPDAQRRFKQFPHEFSGGMRQRAMIAMAIANRPRLIIADEPTTALDVTIQAQVMEVLERAKQETGAGMILITHDLGVVAESADRVVVMYAGRVVEQASVRDLFARPFHPYTASLLNSLPRLDGDLGRLVSIPGQPPNLAELPPGCPFQERCPIGHREVCRTVPPPLLEAAPGRLSACHFPFEAQSVRQVGLPAPREDGEER